MFKFRLTLAGKIFLAALALSLAPILVAGAAWLNEDGQAHARAEQEIDDGLDSFKSDFDRATRDLAALGNWMAGQGEFIDLLQSRNSAALARYMQPWTDVNIADSITVFDSDGVVVAHVGLAQPPAQGTSISNVVGLAEALRGKRASGIVQDNAGRLQGSLVIPVYSGNSGSPLGALSLGFYIDGSFIQYRSKKLGQQIAIVFDDKIAIITLTDQQGKAWGGEPAPPALVQAQKEARASDYLVLDTSIGKHLFRFKPLQSPSGSTVGMYGMGLSLASIDAQRWGPFRTVGIGLVVIVAGAVVLGILFARAFTFPIRALENAAQAMANGDLSTRVDLGRDDELGDLARQLDTMRDQLQKAFESSNLEKSRYAAVIRQMGAAAIITDQKLEIVAVNPAAEGLLGQDQSTLLGKSWPSILQGDGGGQDEASSFQFPGRHALERDRGLVLRGRFRLVTRPHILLDVVSTQVQVGGEPAGFVHVLQDATVQDQLVRAKDEFIVNAAHELRGPLAALRASIEVLLEDHASMSAPERGLMLRTLQRAVVKFQALVENLVDIGNIQAGRFRVRPVPTALAALFDDALTQVSPLLQGRGQSVRVVNDCPGQFVSADRSRVVQVLINLLTNASKYGPEQEPITLTAGGRDEFVQVQVVDRGAGIPEEEQAHLFRRFFRGRRAEEEGIGIGLGLALAHEIILAHGGQMDLISRTGEGTTFWFTLPRADRPPGPRTPAVIELP